MAKFHGQTGRFEDRSKAALGRNAGRFVWQTRNRIVRDHVEHHLAPRKQSHKLVGVVWLVVQAGQQHILERHLTARGGEVLVRRGEDGVEPGGSIDRHDLVS